MFNFTHSMYDNISTNTYKIKYSSNKRTIIVLLMFLNSWCANFIAKIKWKNRFQDDSKNRCLITVDGTDFRIQEPYPWEKDRNRFFYSHKFKGPGLRYEIGVCIKTGHLVWFHGPFPCGKFSDLKIYNLKLKHCLLIGERVIADQGYKGEPTVCTKLQAKNENHRKSMAVCRARHETINRRFKQFQCLQQTWRHDRCKHEHVFQAVITLTQIELENGHPAFQVKCYTDVVNY